MDVQKVALISPMWLNIENPYPPLGIAYVAAVLEKNDYTVKIFDFSLHPEKDIDIKINEVIDFHPDIVGITCMTNTYSNALEIAKRLKKYLNAPIAFGGPHPTVYPEDTLKNPEIDFVIIGEGEYTTLELLQSSRDEVKHVKGLGYKDNGKVFINPYRSYIGNQDEFPHPARHLLNMTAYSLSTPEGEKMATIMSSRGCPYGCTYCFKGLFGRKYRARSPENILEEILELKNKFGYTCFYFIDDIFTFDAERVKKICSLIQEKNLKIGWQCLARVDNVDYDRLKAMKAAGCFKIHLGIESGNAKVLEGIKKGIKLHQVRETVENCKKVGIKTKGYFMLGLPGDTEETMRETITFAYDLDLDEKMFSVTTPFPGTEMWDAIPYSEKIRLSELFNKAYYYASEGVISIMYNMSKESDKKLLEMLRLSEEMQLMKRIERKYGKVIGHVIFGLVRIYPISLFAKYFFVTRNKIRGKLKDIIP